MIIAAAAAESLQSCPTLCNPIDGSPPGSPVPVILRKEHWNGLPFPSPIYESEKWKWSRSVVSDSYSDPMDCSLAGSSARGILQARVLSGLPCLLQTLLFSSVQFSSVAQSCPTRCYSLLQHESQHARPPCPSPSPWVHSNSHLSSWWCHPAISS